MRSRALRSLAAVAAVGLLALTAPSASASGGAFALDCNLNTPPGGNGTGYCTVAGVRAGGSVVTGPATLVYNSVWVTCPIAWVMNGYLSGALQLAVNWTQLGAFVVVTTTGDVNGSAVGAAVLTSPLGLPCGSFTTTHADLVLTGA